MDEQLKEVLLREIEQLEETKKGHENVVASHQKRADEYQTRIEHLKKVINNES